MGREAVSLRPYAADALGLLGAQIRLARVERGWTQAHLGQQAGVSARTVGLIEKGSPTSAVGNVFNCCAVLGMRLFGADPADLARRHRDARTIDSLIPQRVREVVLDADF